MFRASLTVILSLCLTAHAVATKPASLSPYRAATEAVDSKHLAVARKLINDGIVFLLAGQGADGGWSLGQGGAFKPAATAIVLKALVRHPDFDIQRAEIKRGYDLLLSYRQKDGGIYDPKQGYRTYTTCTAVMALAAAGNPQFNSAIRSAEKYLRGVQIKVGDKSPDGTKIKSGDPQVGGVGYGKNGVPNLSVLNWWTDAMHSAGVSGDDPAMKSAINFLAMLQNDSEENPRAVAAQGANDGGFPYDLQTSKAGPGPGGKGLRSYGSMTYAGFKSMLYAGLSRDDSRVRSAFNWIRKYWRLDSNPNMPKLQSQQGLYYYYGVFAKALRAWGEDIITDAKGRKHNWRHELIDALAQRVAKDGSWINTADRWQESNPILVTSYAVLALEEALEK